MTSFSKYPTYKPAGVPWLRQVPEHWGEIKAKYIFRERVEKGFPNEPLLAATQRMGVVTKEAYGERTVTAQKDLHLLKLVEKGDFVISLRSFQGGIEVSHARGIISPAYTVLKVARECNPRYLVFLLKSAPFVDGLRLFITGIREGQNIDYSRLARTYLPWPPLDEQHLIVRYLYALDAKVKRYIRSKRSLIARLQEQKQAIIQQAVTRGLDPNVKLKPSGVEWLGEVPEHWEVRRLSQFGLFMKGRGLARADITVDGLPAILYGDIYTTYEIETDTLRKFTSLEAASKAEVLRCGDIMFTGSGETREDIGKCLTYTGTDFGYAGGDLIILRQRLANSSFLSYYLNSKVAIEQKVLMARGDIIVHIYASSLRRLMIPLPPSKEQESISTYLRTQCDRIKKDIESINASIARMLEYHTRLIADVVTGAVDVRAAAQAISDQTPDMHRGRQLDDQKMEEERLSMAAEGEEGYGEE